LSGVVLMETNLKNVTGFRVDYISINPHPSFAATNANNDTFGTLVFLRSRELSSDLREGGQIMLGEADSSGALQMKVQPTPGIIAVTALQNTVPLTNAGNEQTKFNETSCNRIHKFGQQKDIQSFDWELTGWPKTGQLSLASSITNGSVEILITFFIASETTGLSLYSSSSQMFNTH